MRNITLLWLLLLALAAHAAGVPVEYTLAKAGRVSVAIYDGEGRMVRELARGEMQEAGWHTLSWDGLDQAGRALPHGEYRWRLLQTQGLQAEYLFSLGTSFGDQHWPGQQGGPAAVAVAGEEIYLAASAVAGAPQAGRFTLDGVYRQAYPSPESGATVSDISMGRGNLYLLCANSGHLYVLAPNSGSALRVFNVNLPELGGIPERLAADDRTLLVACPRSGKVGWIDADAGTVLDTAVVEGLADVTLRPDGEVLAIRGEDIVALSRARKTPRVVISGLTMPTRLSFDAHDGSLFVVEAGRSQQIKRYDAAYTLQATYGRPGGRLQGRYHPEDFLAVSAIAGDGHGGFVVSEGEAAPRRTAHFDHAGTLLNEWYGGQSPNCYAAPDPANPAYLWFDSQPGWLVQAAVDYQHRCWHPYATYRYAGLASGMVQGKANASGGWQVRHNGKQTFLLRAQGYPCVLRVDEQGGRLLPVMVSGGNITQHWDAQPRIVQEALGNDPLSKFRSYVWVEHDEQAQPLAAELALSPWSCAEAQWNIDNNFTFFACELPAPGKDYALRTLAPLWHKHVLKYSSFAATTTARLPVDASKLNPAGLPTPVDGCRDAAGNSYLILHGGGDGYVADGDTPAHGYAWPANSIDATALAKWDAHGNLLWRVGAHAAREHAPAGQLHYPVRFAGMVNGCLGVCDRIAQPCEFWTEDGLYAGGVFDRRALDNRPARDYAWWRARRDAADNYTDNTALLPYDMLTGGCLFYGPNGEVLFCAAGWNNCPIYRISGWNHFSRRSGSVHLEEESVGATGAGIGLHAAYVAGQNLHDAPAYEEQEASIWFDARKPWPAIPMLTGPFSARWTGQVEARFSEAYTFAVYAGGGIRLWVGDKCIIDHPESGGRFFSTPVRLTAGQSSPLRLELLQTTGTPEIHLCWESLSQPIEHIPAMYLYPE